MSILLDGHIHIHPTVDRNRLLDAAWQNFSMAGDHLFADLENSSFVLLLAEGKKNDVFSTMQEESGKTVLSTAESWCFQATGEENSVLAVRGDRIIIVIAGRQLISSEKLEVLSLFSKTILPDATYPLAKLTQMVTDDGGIPLLAWGVGKWLGKRGKIINDFIKNPAVPTYFVGDNGNRPTFWPYPKLLSRAEEKNIPSLPGSDPLPIVNHELRAGSYGAAIQSEKLDGKQPASELLQLLSSGAALTPYGRGVGPVRFFRDQLQANLQKRLP